MDKMTELINLQVFERWLQIAAVMLVGGGIVAGLAMRRQYRGLLKGLLVAGLGPLLYLMWIFYRWMVRYDPAHDYVGLHCVSVFIINVVVFVIVGAMLGFIISRIFGSGPQPSYSKKERDSR